MDVLGIGSGLICCVSLPLISGLILLASAIRIVPENKRFRVFRLGQEIGEKGPGIVLLIPFIDRVEIIDLNSQSVRDTK
jgi:regulator of protease activity HflC (stomatin/prohibitin superfamily)